MVLIPCDLESCGRSWIEAVVEETAEIGLPVEEYHWLSSDGPDTSILSVTVGDQVCLLRFLNKDIAAVRLQEDVRYRLVWHITNKLSLGDFRLMPS